MEPLPMEELDVHDELIKQRREPIEDLVSVVLVESNLTRTVRISSLLNKEDHQHLASFLQSNMDIFT